VNYNIQSHVAQRNRLLTFRTTQSYAEAIQQGHFQNQSNERMETNERNGCGDVYYNKFLINGKTKANYLNSVAIKCDYEFQMKEGKQKTQ
jgi:hypothetical protein